MQCKCGKVKKFGDWVELTKEEAQEVKKMKKYEVYCPKCKEKKNAN